MGPWSRSFVAAVAGNADRPELEVGARRIDPGEIWAVVEGCEVTLTAHVIPPRIWASMARYAQGMGQLEQSSRGPHAVGAPGASAARRLGRATDPARERNRANRARATKPKAAST